MTIDADHWLVAGAEGDLVLVAAGRHLSAMARLIIDDAGRPSLAGMRVLHERIRNRPYAGKRGVTYVTDADRRGGARLRFLGYGELASGHHAYHPAMAP